jgi:glycerol kinase
VNDLLMRFRPICWASSNRPAVLSHGLGAAYLAGLATGVYDSTDRLTELWRAALPTLPAERARN